MGGREREREGEREGGRERERGGVRGREREGERLTDCHTRETNKVAMSITAIRLQPGVALAELRRTRANTSHPLTA